MEFRCDEGVYCHLLFFNSVECMWISGDYSSMSFCFLVSLCKLKRYIAVHLLNFVRMICTSSTYVMDIYETIKYFSFVSTFLYCFLSCVQRIDV